MSTIAESAVLPLAASTLLEAYAEAHPGTTIRVWLREDGRLRLVFPTGAEDGAAPAGDARVLALEAGAELVIEAPPEAAAFLETALSSVFHYEREARSAARELSERYEEINLLYSISEVLGSTASMKAAASRILSEVAEVMAARRASLWVLEPADRALHLAAAVGEEGLTGPVPVDDPHSVTARVFRERRPLNLERGQQLPDGSRLDQRPRGQEAYLSVPINFTPRDGESRTVGVITLVGRRTSVRFNAGDEQLLTAIASQVGAALEAHRLMAESVRRERLERELELAHDLQLKLLPVPAQLGTAQSIAARCVPAESVGGDFYHLLPLSGERIGVVIGDVSSHGFSAALIMAMTISAVAIYAQESASPVEVVTRVHGALIDELQTTEMHVSLFYGVLDPEKGRLVYANAGHPHAFRIDGDGIAHRLGAINAPIGTLPDDDYGEEVVEWEVGRDLLLLFTDGLSDAYAAMAGTGGEKLLVDEIAALRNEPPEQILGHVFKRADRANPTVPPDDRTAVLIRV